MAGVVRVKRVTAPLDDRVKACLCGAGHHAGTCATNGSEHDGDSPASSLSDLVHDFLFDDASDCLAHQEMKESEDDDGPNPARVCRSDPAAALREVLDRAGDSDVFRAGVRAAVTEAVGVISGLRYNRAAFRRAVMGFLRDAGYNAAVCKTKWESSGVHVAGNYEFIDVLRPDHDGGSGGAGFSAEREKRYIVDVDFAAEFEIARPTGEFAAVLAQLPRVFVGLPEELKQVVRTVAEAARLSIKARGMHLPPWRKNRYLQAKWLGPYHRTTNRHVLQANLPAPEIVRCRAVGFAAAPGGAAGTRRFVVL